jgi:hypothetical protein
MNRAWLSPVLWLVLDLATTAAGAHSASDAYLTLDTAGKDSSVVAHGEWDIALRDLDFVLKLDDDGDGRITWGELKHHQADIAHYAVARLVFVGRGAAADRVGKACAINVTRQQVAGHADGTYAALFFDVVCARPATSLHLHYDLFFDIDPSHRGILVMHSGDDVATALLSPEKASIDLPL